METAAALSAAYAAGERSPVEVVRAALAAIAADQERLNAWVHVAGEAALAAAAESEARWRRRAALSALDGIPVGVKDLLAVVGQPMRRGSRAYPEDNYPAEDTPIVARLREAGAVLLGKTATPDAGCKLDTTSLVHGITRNPFDPRLTAGGSSGGSAVVVACGHVPVAIGTDGAGSIRVPAAFCGIFGMKPTTGRIPAPIGPFWPHAVTGPMTGTVADTALVWNVVTKADWRDPYALPVSGVDWVVEAGRGVAGLRVAVATRFWGMGTEPGLELAVRNAGVALADAGASVGAAEPDWPCDVLSTFMVFWRCMYGQSVGMMPGPQAALIDPAIKEIVAGAGAVSKADLQLAMAERDQISLAMARFHTEYDVLICPVMPCQPWGAGRAAPAAFAETDWGWCPFTYPFNMTRQPAASVPVGRDENGLPLAVQIVAAAGRDDLVLRAAAVLEKRAG